MGFSGSRFFSIMECYSRPAKGREAEQNVSDFLRLCISTLAAPSYLFLLSYVPFVFVVVYSISSSIKRCFPLYTVSMAMALATQIAHCGPHSCCSSSSNFQTIVFQSWYMSPSKRCQNTLYTRARISDRSFPFDSPPSDSSAKCVIMKG